MVYFASKPIERVVYRFYEIIWKKPGSGRQHASRGEEAKIGLADEAMAIVSSGQKDRVKRSERFCINLGT